MMDRLSANQRSDLMSNIRSKGTLPEKQVASILRSMRYRFTLHDSTLPGTPDFVHRRRKLVIFVHGCFWHRHTCRNGRSMPKTRPKLWRGKFERNRDRDRKAKAKLRRMGWRHFTVWECQLKREEWLIDRIINFLES